MTFKELEKATCRGSAELVANMPLGRWYYLIGESSKQCEELELLGVFERGDALSGMQWPIWRKVKDLEAG